MTISVTPLQDRAVVRRLEQKEIAKGGIIIPDTAKEKPQEGGSGSRRAWQAQLEGSAHRQLM